MAETRASATDWLAVAAGTLGAFMAALDISITNASLPQIQGEIGATGTEGTWIATGYLVAEIIMIPLAAWAVRIFTLRLFLLVCTVAFVLFSVVCGLADSLGQMIVGRVGQGFFGGALIPTAMTIIAVRLPPSQQAIGLALFGGTSVLAPVFGPLLGGWLTDNASWHWLFFLNVPVGGVLLLLLMVGLPTERPRLEELAHADWIGIAGLVLFLGALTVVLEDGQREHWFESALITRLTFVAAIGAVLLAWSQATRPDPALRLRLLKHRSFLGAFVVSLIMGGAFYTVLYILPVFLSTIAGYDAEQTGVVAMYSGVGAMLAIPLVTVSGKYVDGRLIVAAGLALFAFTCFLDTTLTDQSRGSDFITSQLIRGVGQVAIFFPLSQAALAGIPEEDAADASGLFNMSRNLGGSIGLALTAVLIDLRTAFHGQQLAQGVTANVSILKILS